MEWQEPAIVLETAPYGEGDLLVCVLTPLGVWRGLAKGGASRRKIAIWQKGNLLSARWVARLAEQLGAITGELVHPGAALAMQSAENLAILEAACALAAGALPEREPHRRCLRRPGQAAGGHQYSRLPAARFGALGARSAARARLRAGFFVKRRRQ